MKKFGSGIRDEKKSDPGSGINIPDPQRCKLAKRKIEKAEIDSKLLLL
jgi:hypothetical protein